MKDWSFKKKEGQEGSILRASRAARKPLKAIGTRAELFPGDLYSLKPVKGLSHCEDVSSAPLTDAQNHTNLPFPRPQPLG